MIGDSKFGGNHETLPGHSYVVSDYEKFLITGPKLEAARVGLFKKIGRYLMKISTIMHSNHGL